MPFSRGTQKYCAIEVKAIVKMDGDLLRCIDQCWICSEGAKFFTIYVLNVIEANLISGWYSYLSPEVLFLRTKHLPPQEHASVGFCWLFVEIEPKPLRLKDDLR